MANAVEQSIPVLVIGQVVTMLPVRAVFARWGKRPIALGVPLKVMTQNQPIVFGVRKARPVAHPIGCSTFLDKRSHPNAIHLKAENVFQNLMADLFACWPNT